MPRSGSTMLCNLLGQAGNAGQPNSFFREKSMADFANHWGIPAKDLSNFDQSYLNTAIAKGSGDTGCFGLRIMWDNLAALCARLGAFHPDAKDDPARLTATFGPMRYIHLSRDDKVAEAVSLTIAHQTGLWHRNADGSELERLSPPEDPVYDHAAIAAEYAGVVDGDAAWRAWFAAHHITPFDISYEDLAAAPQDRLADILTFIGADPAPAKAIIPGTAKLTTARNKDWASRFRAEAGIASPTAPA